MKVCREQVAENRLRILEVAGELFKAQGFDKVTVCDVMKAAGLTHGGFYGYFKSKDDLIAQTITHLLSPAPPRGGLARIAEHYLSTDHCGNMKEGCPVAALATETLRQAPEARAAMADGVRRRIGELARSLAGDDDRTARREAIAGMSTMIGALILARLCDDPAMTREILEETRTWLSDREQG